MKQFGLEVRPLTADDMSVQPKVFKEDGSPKLARHYNWGFIFTEGASKPLYYMRSATQTGYRSGNLCDVGDGPLAPQTPSPYFDRLVQKMETPEPYHQCGKNPDVFIHHSEDPFTEFIYTGEGATWKEGDLLDLKVEYFPIAFFTHEYSSMEQTYMHQHVLYTGTLDGKKVCSLGAIDRLYVPQGAVEVMKIDEAPKFYTLCVCSGIRKDGRKEAMWASLSGKNGEGFGYYWLEGEEPVISNTITVDADWQRYPYLPEADHSVGYTKAVWTIGNKKIHITNHWSSKGHTQTPRVEMPGFSQNYGTWYEGDTPYEHVLYHNLCEHHQATTETAEDAGITIG